MCVVISANTNCTHWKRYVYLLLSAISRLLYATYFMLLDDTT